MTDPTPEDVERVARVIKQALGEAISMLPATERGDWSAAPSGVIDLGQVARAAIAAMPDHSALIRELRDALKKWGSHSGWCASNRWPALDVDERRISGRMAVLGAFGNAIVPELAAEFIAAANDAITSSEAA